jgi:dTDP-4-dehydrorhamnose reductase
MVEKYKLLITGSNGQLGKALMLTSKSFSQYKYKFLSKKELDISDYSKLNKKIIGFRPDLIINCAAFTKVDLAETMPDTANLINSISVKNLAKICLRESIKLIHISTDFVFDGKKSSPYLETDFPNPISVYGRSKLMGEKNIIRYNLKNSIIIRTSWLYSPFSDNFVNKIKSKIENRDNFNVVNDQIGSPTCVFDLAKALLLIIPKLKFNRTEIFHFSSAGYCSRHELASKINMLINGKSKINPTLSKDKIRPKFSALSSQKFIDYFDIYLDSWDKMLKFYFLNNLHKNET